MFDRTIRPVLSGLAVLGAAALAAGCGLALEPTPAHAPAWTWPGYPACATEDSAGPCYWDAKERGNHQGTSFVVDADQVTHYGDGGTPGWHVVTRDEAYASYLAAYGEGNGCREDFDATYRGTRFIADLPKSVKSDVAYVSKNYDGPPPFIVDYPIKGEPEGSAIQVIAAQDQVIIIGQYTGACEAK